MLESLLYAILYLGVLLICVLIVFYSERKIAAFMQDRLGPMEVGKFGLLQALADLLKMIQKEDIVPAKSDKLLFKIAPIFIFTVIFMGFACIPLSSSIQPSIINISVFFVFTIISLDVIGLLIAGWSSNNKYALFGSMRAIAQIISYEIPVGLSVLAVIIASNSLDLQEICFQQSGFELHKPEYFLPNTNYLFGIKSLGIETNHIAGFLNWNIFRSPILFFAYIIYFIATLAECNRAPFDIPEAESELIAGYHVEYSGFRFAIFYLAEYAMMFLTSLLGAILYLGGWNSPLPNIDFLKLYDWTSGTPNEISAQAWGVFWICSKAIMAMWVHIWIRWTFPRLRVDQLMYLCWKVLTPAALLIVLFSSFWKILSI